MKPFIEMSEEELEAASYELQREADAVREKRKELKAVWDAKITERKLKAVLKDLPAGSVNVLADVLKAGASAEEVTNG